MTRPPADASCCSSRWPRSSPAAAGGDDGGSSARSTTRSATCRRTPPVVVTSTPTSTASSARTSTSCSAKFPFGGQVKSQIKQSLTQQGVDFDKDVKPLLGNELVVGVARRAGGRWTTRRRTSTSSSSPRDGGKLARADREGGRRARSPASIDGDDVYESRRRIGVGPQGRHAGRRQRPRRRSRPPLQRHDGDDKLTEDDFNARVRGPAGGRARARLRRRAGAARGRPGDRRRRGRSSGSPACASSA